MTRSLSTNRNSKMRRRDPRILPLLCLLVPLLCSCVISAPRVAGIEPPRADTPIIAAAGIDVPGDLAPEPDPLPQDDSQANDADDAESVSDDEPRFGNFSEDILARTILAELAGQRGYNQQALDDYLTLARETGDLSIIKRALNVATFLRDVPASLEMGNLWLEKEPDSTQARQAIALQLVTLGRYRDALEYLIALLERGQEVDFRLISARTVNDDNAALYLDALISDFLALSQRFPDNHSLRLGLAHLYQQNEQIREAYNVVQQLAKDMDDNPEVVMLEVQLMEMLGEGELAQRRLTESLRNNPDHKQLRFMYGRKLVAEERFQDAREQFEIIVEQDPDDFDMLYSLALLSMEVNMFSEARDYLQRLVMHGQRLDDAHYYLGVIDARENRTDSAIDHYLNVKGGNNFLLAQRDLTELMVRAGRYEEVKAHLQNIRYRNADYNIQLLAMEAGVLMDENHDAIASELLNNAIGAFPNNIQLLFLRSLLSQEHNDLALMEQDLRKIIQLNPTSPVAYNSLGYTLADRTDRFEEAYDLIKRAVELAPDDPAIMDSLGWVQYRLGMYEEARRNLDRAYELYPDHEVAAHLGEVLWVMGQRSEASRIWRNALEAQPDSEHIRDAMERLDPDASI